MNTADLHMLTGAYVLHALSPEEHADFERHLRACPSCAQEVRELAATAGKLAAAVEATAPAELKPRVMARIAAERQEPPVVARQARRVTRLGRRAVPRLVLAACVAAAAAFGGIAVWQHQQAEDARAQAQRAEQRADELTAVLAAPDAVVSGGELADGARATVVVSRSRNQAVFVASGMPEPPAGSVYQLWYDDEGGMRPAGLMDPSQTAQVLLMDGPLDGATGMGVTVEPAGGSPQPTSAPVALMSFPA
ncbi:anti-sigma factor [Streptomyces sp. C10-9-1]|uniref:anti-sigma factor n=1 Tax=Streptomyces sp. C10-9-1 TaxID=1859285 RepID=UPI002113005D|nr:anti-sigma factor [Streptomyces sp. C10-9-1]MCQ6554216.1 anti-sigma factor [Streptomyces sp. C10-9-1]